MHSQIDFRNIIHVLLSTRIKIVATSRSIPLLLLRWMNCLFLIKRINDWIDSCGNSNTDEFWWLARDERKKWNWIPWCVGFQRMQSDSSVFQCWCRQTMMVMIVSSGSTESNDSYGTRVMQKMKNVCRPSIAWNELPEIEIWRWNKQQMCLPFWVMRRQTNPNEMTSVWVGCAVLRSDFVNKHVSPSFCLPIHAVEQTRTVDKL